ncbi:MAG: hypothetical protein H6566_28860 [Lewinellaceae bacterium]|nr:hypothetical protein [Lewinellaceae bacterium]
MQIVILLKERTGEFGVFRAGQYKIIIIIYISDLNIYGRITLRAKTN